mmetsp:Transcript_47521/g.107721  ORF Transcript_47521/g.107721 Transcript_47521/m.107721 type:complete len:209 (+) Transcript_47521:3061-3687(+)
MPRLPVVSMAVKRAVTSLFLSASTLTGGLMRWTVLTNSPRLTTPSPFESKTWKASWRSSRSRSMASVIRSSSASLCPPSPPTLAPTPLPPSKKSAEPGSEASTGAPALVPGAEAACRPKGAPWRLGPPKAAQNWRNPRQEDFLRGALERTCPAEAYAKRSAGSRGPPKVEPRVRSDPAASLEASLSRLGPRSDLVDLKGLPSLGGGRP